MKSNLLLLLIAILILNGSTFAQSFIASDSVGVNVSNNGNIIINGNANTSTIKTLIKITNTSALTNNLKVRRNILSMTTGSVTSFCWAGGCFGPNISNPTNILIIAAGEDSIAFEADFYPTGYEGTSTVTYTFFNKYDANDSIKINIIYNISVSGINDIILNNNISKAYPNPASSSVNFSYKLDYNKTGYITIHNILGEQVKKVNISAANNGEINISTSELKTGAYFYSFFINEKSIKTGKLIINR